MGVPSRNGSAAMGSVSTTLKTAIAEADRVTPDPASVPETPVCACTVPAALARHDQVNSTDPPGGRSAEVGEGVPQEAELAGPRVSAAGVRRFIADAPLFPTRIEVEKKSPRSTAAGSEREAVSVCTTTVGLVAKGWAVTVAPEFASVPAAAVSSWMVPPVAAVAPVTRVQLKIAERPPGMSAGAWLKPPPATAPPVTITVGGSGVGSTPAAVASPELITASVVAKGSPGATEPGTCSQRTASCGGICTTRGSQPPCTVAEVPARRSVPVPDARSPTEPESAATAAKRNVRVWPAGRSWAPGDGSRVKEPGPDWERGAKASPFKSTSPELVASNASSIRWPTLTVAGGGPTVTDSVGGRSADSMACASDSTSAARKASVPLARKPMRAGPREVAESTQVTRALVLGSS